MTAGPGGTDLAVLGRAVTEGQTLPLGVDDPVIAARAVRRALADAGRRAVDVTDLIVASPDPITTDVLAGFARRALGTRGADVCVSCLVRAAADAEALAAHAAAGMTEALRLTDGLGLALGLGSDGTTVALCLGPAAAAAGLSSRPRLGR